MPDADPRNLRPIELAQIINSTAAGEIADDRDLRYIRTAAGVQTTSSKDSNRVDVIKYTSWLEASRHQTKNTSRSSAQSATSLNAEYEAIKERARARGSSVSKSGRDIGEIPPIKNMRRRRKAIRSFKYFCECYFPETFNLPWSKDHLKVIAKIEEVVKNGGLFSLAMSRGSGKTTIIERATIYSKIIGVRPFTAVIGASEGHATMMLDSIKTEFETNDYLLEDFPEICYPIQCLDGINQRAAGQLYLGHRTRIEWTQKHIVLPTIPGSKASGSIIMVAGITGRIRGMKMTRADGSTIRPSLVLIDDPQTDESAKSPPQCAERERILAGAILGLAGPAKKIAGLMTVTVIRPDDMAERILDREKHPEWQGERMKMLYSLPNDETLWDQYAQLRAEGLKAGAGIKQATAFYRKNRKAMNEGAEVAWKARYNEDELSAIQHAMNLKFRDEAAFWAEYQNEPLPEFDDNEDLLTADEIAAKTNGLARGIVPLGCNHITMFIDVMAKALFYVVTAWQDDCTGSIIDYGTEPDQKIGYYTLRDIKRTLKRAKPGAGLEAAIYSGLERITKAKIGKEWKREDGSMMRIERCLIDANWGDSTNVVYQFCRQSEFAGVLMPSHGRGIGPSDKPMHEIKKKQGDRIGLNWRVPVSKGKRAIRYVIYDTNFWKSFFHKRIAVPIGDIGCVSLFGKKASTHRLFAEHMTAEHPVKTEGRGRVVDVWKMRRIGLDNHFFDGMVGCCVGASMQGAALPGTSESTPYVARRKRKRIKFSEIQQQNRMKRWTPNIS